MTSPEDNNIDNIQRILVNLQRPSTRLEPYELEFLQAASDYFTHSGKLDERTFAILSQLYADKGSRQ